MKTFFKVIAWFGLVLFTLGAIIAFYGSWVFLLAEPGERGVLFEYMFAMWFGIPGIVLMIIGGIISKPKNFWLASIITGVFYIISFFYAYIHISESRFIFIIEVLSISVLPGLIAVIMGIQLKKDEKNIPERLQPVVPIQH
jgi:membrane-bound ClpP family serine protease